jgi:hypothetical protein
MRVYVGHSLHIQPDEVVLCDPLCDPLCRLEITPVADIRYPSGDLCVDINECEVDTQLCPIATIEVPVFGGIKKEFCLQPQNTTNSTGDSCIPGGQCINAFGSFYCAPVMVPFNAPLIPTPGGDLKITDQHITFVAFGMLFASYCDRCGSTRICGSVDGALSWETSLDPK